MRRAILALLIVLLLPLLATADRRNYVWTYQYLTMPEGATELEFYQTTKVKDPIDAWEYRIEVEHGLTSHWDVSVYQIFGQTEGTPLQWSSVQFRTRYRLGEEGLWPVDPLLYFEYNRKTDSKQKDKLEGKVILAKTSGKWNVAVNPVYEYLFAPGTKHEIGLDLGISYEISPKLSVGVESTSRVEFEDGESEVGSYAGPTISIASGGWWYTIGAAVGLTDDSDDTRVRFLMGIEL